MSDSQQKDTVQTIRLTYPHVRGGGRPIAVSLDRPMLTGMKWAAGVFIVAIAFELITFGLAILVWLTVARRLVEF